MTWKPPSCGIIPCSPVLSPIGEGKWIVRQDFRILGVTVPRGFVCDLDSVPRIPFVHSRYKGRTASAAVLHDYLYVEQITDRRTADILFLLAMNLEGVKVRFQVPVYWAVRLFGGGPWRRNRKRKA